MEKRRDGQLTLLAFIFHFPFSIFHISFAICHRPNRDSAMLNGKCNMENGK
jgi:hypothetical protein